MIQGYFSKLCPKFKWQVEEVKLNDGQMITLEWAVNSQPYAESGLQSSQNDTPIVLIHHGAYCNSRDMPGADYIAEAHKRGWIVAVFNRRNHSGRKYPLTKPCWNFFGSTEDVKYVTNNYILKRRPNAQLFMIGLSAGSGLLAKFFGESELFTAGC